MQQYVTWFWLSMSLVLAPFMGLPAPSVTVPDVNGDHRANILDIQRVAAALFDGPSPSPQADVNHDGRVDILDFQLLVACTSRSTTPARPPAPSTEQTMVCDTPESGPLKRGSVVERQVLLAPPLEWQAASLCSVLLQVLPSSKAERYRVGSLSHSPPRRE